MTLTDLDELVLEVKSKNTREYIIEAIQAYRSHLFRAAVILTWTAVAYDLIVKFRELGEHDDKLAAQLSLELDKAIEANDVSKLQRIEGELLNHARDEFEMIGNREYEDLDRLRKDRHLCAHPAFTRESVLFNPSPELVRSHILHAITHVLQQLPIQGKAALARLKADLLRPSFPLEQTQVTAFLKMRYFQTIKSSLVGDVITVLLKSLLLQSDAELTAIPESLARCLTALAELQPHLYEQQASVLRPK